MDLDEALAALPLIAILRGLQPQEAVDVTTALHDAGFRIVEVPLNSPSPLSSIERIVRRFEGRMLIGAGTVLEIGALADVAAAGGRLIVSPNFEEEVVRSAKRKGLISVPGVATPSEAFAALAAGADAIKLFPAEMITPAVLRSLRAVLPKEAKLIPVGGITPANIAAYLEAGADGFGIGSALFRSGKSIADIARAASAFVEAVRRRS
ncbi:MAG: 2-dehydro-3-deoxy-6-phosphogalactonate aldolase [Hyphomicrobiales bacterium]